MEHLPQAEYHLTADRGTALIATRDGRRRLVAVPDLHLIPSIRAHGYLTLLAGLEALERTLESAGQRVGNYALGLGGRRDLLAHLDGPEPDDFIDALATDCSDGPHAPLLLRDRLLARLGRWGAWGALHDRQDQQGLELLEHGATFWPHPGHAVHPAPGTLWGLDGILACLADGTDEEASAMVLGVRAVARQRPRTPFLARPTLAGTLDRLRAQRRDVWLDPWLDENPRTRAAVIAEIGEILRTPGASRP